MYVILTKLVKIGSSLFPVQVCPGQGTEIYINKFPRQLQAWNNTISRIHHSIEIEMKNNNDTFKKYRKT